MSMEYPFQKLTKFLAEEGLELSVSVSIPKKQLGQVVIVGGKITFICEDFMKNSEGNYCVEIDDGLGTLQIYFVPPVYKTFKDYIKTGNIIAIKGRVAERTVNALTNTYVAATSVALLEEADIEEESDLES